VGLALAELVGVAVGVVVGDGLALTDALGLAVGWGFPETGAWQANRLRHRKR